MNNNNLNYLVNKYLTKCKSFFEKYNLFYICYLHTTILFLFHIYILYVLLFNYTGKFNTICFVIIYILVLHWIIYNGECFIGYYIKKMINPNYKAGDLPGSLDLDFKIPSSKWVSDINDSNIITNIKNKYHLYYVSIFGFLVILSKIKMKPNNKILALFIFLILIISVMKKTDKNIRILKKNLKDRNNRIFNF